MAGHRGDMLRADDAQRLGFMVVQHLQLKAGVLKRIWSR